MFENIEPLVIGAIFSVVHFISPYVALYRKRLEPHLSSISGGFAVAYIFLELLPSVDTYHSVVGERIYFFILIGFAVFYGIEFGIERHQKAASIAKTKHVIILIQAILYNFLLAIAIGKEAPETIFLAFVFSLLISFHLMSNDLGLLEELGEQFTLYGRFLLIIALVLGLGIHFIAEPSEILMDLIAATVAGIVLYRVSQSELPKFEEADFLSFGLGSLLFIGLHILLVSG